MDTRIDILIKPIWFDRIPTARIGIDGDLKEIAVTEPTWFNFSIDKPRDSKIVLTIEHYGKTNKDTDMINNRDTALCIEEIKLNDLTSPKFIWASMYCPDYPDHYPDKIPELHGANYLGWNGIWTLDLTVPIYTWIHQVEGLGWIYD